MTERLRYRVLTILPLLLLSPAKAATPSNETSASPQGNKSAPHRPSAPRIIRIGYLPATHDALLFIATDLKLFDERVIAPQLKSYDNSVQILNDLKSGFLDIGIPGIATPATEIAGKAPLSIIGGAASKSAALVASPALAKEIVGAKTLPEKLQKLVDRRVGAVRGSTGLAILRQGLVAAGVPQKRIDLREYAKPSDIITALTTNTLDAGLLWSPHMTIAESKQLPIALWMTEILPDHVCCRQIASDAFLRENRETAVHYLMGIVRAEQALRRAASDAAVKADVLKAMKNHLPNLTQDQLERELFANEPRTTLGAALRPKSIALYLEAMKAAGFLREDQCQHVASKVRVDLLRDAFSRLGCSAADAERCVSSGDALCACLQ